MTRDLYGSMLICSSMGLADRKRNFLHDEILKFFAESVTVDPAFHVIFFKLRFPGRMVANGRHHLQYSGVTGIQTIEVRK